jgi:hypothetical protein
VAGLVWQFIKEIHEYNGGLIRYSEIIGVKQQSAEQKSFKSYVKRG